MPNKFFHFFHHHQILHIRNSLGTKFQLKLKILIFRTKFAQKGIPSLNQVKPPSPLNSAYSN